jgi:hypothetical protein
VLAAEPSEPLSGVILYALACLVVVLVMVILLATVLGSDSDEDAQEVEEDGPRDHSESRRGSRP